MTSPVPTGPDLVVPFSHIATFIRQVTHDVRNDLNSMDLQAAFAVELIEDPEANEEVKRIRQLIHQAAKKLQALSGNFQLAAPSMVTYSAKIFFEDLRDRFQKVFPEQAGEVKWDVSLGEESITIDIEMIFSAIAEVFRNAFQFRESGQGIEARAFAEGGRMVLEIIEGKSSVPSAPADWGKEPFVSTRRGGYGLGLFRARRILALHGGELAASHDSAGARLTTRVSLPLAD